MLFWSADLSTVRLLMAVIRSVLSGLLLSPPMEVMPMPMGISALMIGVLLLPASGMSAFGLLGSWSTRLRGITGIFKLGT